jgi:two-component system cell cycle sensor histidine kinase/response regulator CckA
VNVPLGFSITSRVTTRIAERGGMSLQRSRVRAVRVLLAEDSADDAWLLQRHLERSGMAPQIVRVQDEAGLLGALRAGDWDVVLADYSMPTLTGLDVVRLVRRHDPDMPCLLVSGSVTDDTAIEAMRAGANDYLLKHDLVRLVPVIERELHEAAGRRQRRRAEQALAASEERLRLVIEQSPDALATFTADGRILEWNARASALFGFSRGEAVGQCFSALALAPSWRSAFQSALADRFHGARLVFGLRTRSEVEGIHRDGRVLPLEVTVVAVPSSAAGLSFCIFMCDLTDRHAADATRASLELQLRQAQKMEAVGKLAGGIAHDFNNLLTVIQGQALLLESGLLPADERPAAVSAIVQASEKATDLTRQLLTFSRRRVVRLAPMDLNSVVLDLGKLLRRLIGADVELRTHLAPGIVGIEADASMIEQVLMNLAVNARDAMPDGGSLVVSTAIVQAAPPPAAIGAGCGPGPFVRLSVRDSGSGISAELLPHIFEPFFTTKDATRSSGLGLATVFGIVEQHRGWVEVESQMGTGSTFHVYLPHRRGCSVTTPGDGLHASLPRGHECVLVVEDELAVREMVRDVLVRQGFEVLEAGSGREALEVWAAHGDRVDLVLTDIMMPGGMTGLDLIEQLRQRRPALKVLVTSGCRSDSSHASVPLEDGDNFIPKPYRPTALVRLVRERLDADRHRA